MHELGIMANIVDRVEEFAKGNGVSLIDTLVLEIGAFSSVVPRYIEECYPAVIEGTMLERAKLRIDIVPGKAICHDCDRLFPVQEGMQACPHCGGQNCELVSGREFMIKEIVAR
jgi:hydrogenase nickel incorporation protein HypA/HybF